MNETGHSALSYVVTTTGGTSQDGSNGVLDVWSMTSDGYLEDIGW